MSVVVIHTDEYRRLHEQSARLDKAEARVAELEAALEAYANRANWKVHPDLDCTWVPGGVYEEGWATASAVLEGRKEGRKEWGSDGRHRQHPDRSG